MTCDAAQRRISRAADGSVMDADFWRHLERCSVCSTILEDHATVSYLLTTCAPRPVPPGFSRRVRLRIALRTSLLEWTDWKSWTLRLAPLAAGLAVAAIVWLWPAAPRSLEAVMRNWTDVRGQTPVTALFWHDVPDDVLLQAVLDGRPEASMRHYYTQDRYDQ
jgi:hypothetical protein